MKLVILPAIATLVLAGPAWAQDRAAAPLKAVQSATRNATIEPAATGFVSGAQVYPFNDGTIYQVYTAPGLVTDIRLQPGETLVAVASGDTARWVIGDTTSGGSGSGSGDGKQTHVLVKPVSAGLLTNVVITTDRRAYHLRLASTPATALSSLRWAYPQDELLAVRRKAEPASPNSLLAGSVIAASLITGLNSDLPGMVIAQVIQNVFDTVTGTILLVPQGSPADLQV